MENKTHTEIFIERIYDMIYEYGIRTEEGSCETDRRRICILLKDILLRLPARTIWEIMKPVCVERITRARTLSEVEAAVYMCDLFELALFARLKGARLICDTLEAERKHGQSATLKLSLEGIEWESAITKFNIPIVDRIVRILTGQEIEEKEVSKNGAREEGIQVEQPAIGQEAGGVLWVQKEFFGKS